MITDVFLVCSGDSERQVAAIVDGIEEALLTERRRKPLRREGERDARWVLLDYGDIVVHVQHAEDRAFYALERLWRDAPVIDLQTDYGPLGVKSSHSTGARAHPPDARAPWADRVTTVKAACRDRSTSR